jgi:Ca2+-binding EF-hand superfamily protein
MVHDEPIGVPRSEGDGFPQRRVRLPYARDWRTNSRVAPKPFEIKGNPNRSPPKLTEAAIQRLQVQFKKMGLNDDGMLSRDELIEYARRLELGPALADLAFALYDKHGRGYLTFDQYVDFMGLVRSADTEPEILLKRVFDLADVVGAGYVDPAEFAQLLRHLGIRVTRREVEAEFQMIARSHGGKVAFAAFCEQCGGRPSH